MCRILLPAGAAIAPGAEPKVVQPAGHAQAKALLELMNSSRFDGPDPEVARACLTEA